MNEQRTQTWREKQGNGVNGHGNKSTGKAVQLRKERREGLTSLVSPGGGRLK